MYLISSNGPVEATEVLEYVLLPLHRFLPKNHNHVRRETHPLLRFRYCLLKQLSPLRLSAQLQSFVSGREQVTRVFQPHQEVVGVGFALFVDRWQGGGVDIDETVFAEKGFECGDPAFL